MKNVMNQGPLNTTYQLIGTLGLLLVSACSGEAVVGEAGTIDEGESTSLDDETDHETDANCDEHYGELVQNYADWKSAENEWGDLQGKTLSGYVEGGPELTLSIDENGAGTLLVGTPEPLGDANEGYLCNDCASDALQEGGSYPIYGALVENSRLTFLIYENAPFDPWCDLQTPVIRETNQKSCDYAVVRNAETEFEGGICKLGEEEVDCGWLRTAKRINGSPCACTPTECFAAITPGGTETSIDARVDLEKNEVSGSLIAWEETHRIFFEVSDN